jgi:calcineurin-like phosphoesterase family protein
MGSPEVYYTSDTHWNHQSMVIYGWRPFSTVEDMNDMLLTAWNEQVRPKDIVFHLGDWAMGNAAAGLEFVRKVHGTVHLITGNHDAPWVGHRDALKVQRQWLDAGFASISPFARRRIYGRNVLLSHFPYEGDHRTDKIGEDRFNQYRLRDEGLPLLHGHVHDLWRVRGRQINVGVDVWAWAPVHQDMLAPIVGMIEEPAA